LQKEEEEEEGIGKTIFSTFEAKRRISFAEQKNGSGKNRKSKGQAAIVQPEVYLSISQKLTLSLRSR
jgi:hypothetical protein